MAELIEAELKQGWIAKFPGSRADAQQLAKSHRYRQAKCGACRRQRHSLQRKRVVSHPRASRIAVLFGRAPQLPVFRPVWGMDWRSIRRESSAQDFLSGKAHCITIQSVILGQNSQHCSADCYTAFCRPHRLWLYVDDLLVLLHKARVKEDVALIVALLSALGVPISWRKAQLGADITWCGWTFNFDCETVRLTAEKLAKLRAQLYELRHSRKILRKKLESGLGLLIWATSTARHLRPYLAPLYKDLHSARGTLKQIHHSQWQPFLDSLNQEAVVSRQPIGVWLRALGS